ncbi:MAG: DUF4255 domain-containing protein [Bacteroidota bacterium]
MIDHVLSTLVGDLNSYLMRRLESDESVVELSALVNLDGSVAFRGQNKILCSLVAVQQDRSTYNVPLSKTSLKNPPVQLNLFVLFSAYYQAANYREALKSLSSVIAFFQGKQVFTPQNTPGLHQSAEKIAVELFNFDLKELSHFWTAFGVKHLPSVLYRLRLVNVTEDMVLLDLPEITSFSTKDEIKK